MIHLDRRYLLLISNKLRNFKEKRTNLFNCSCPICGDSQYNPLKARGYFYESKRGLRYKCHNCGINISFHQLLKQIDTGKYKEYVLEKFKENKTKSIISPKIKIEKNDNLVNSKLSYNSFCTSIKELPDEHYAKIYVKSRKIPEHRWNEIYYVEDFKKYMDNVFPEHQKDLIENDPRLIWFLTDLHGKITHVCGRGLKTDNKLRYIKAKISKSEDQKIFGFNNIKHFDPLYVVEGEIDSMFLSNAVSPGDSSLELAANSLYERFKPYYSTINIVLVWDNEPRNKEIVRQLELAIKNGHQVVIWSENIRGKDINEMILNGHIINEIEMIMKNNTYSGISAELVFSKWRKW